jgi:hypothetical protein
VYQAGSSGCQPGYLYQAGACVYSGAGAYTGAAGVGGCSAGYVYSGGQCVYTGGTVSCPAGYAAVNNVCQYVGPRGCSGYSNYYNPYANC